MKKVQDEVLDVVENTAQQTNETTITEETQTPLTPIFDEINDMNPGMAVNILIQAANMAVSAGALTLRDNVLVAKAISVLRPGSI